MHIYIYIYAYTSHASFIQYSKSLLTHILCFSIHTSASTQFMAYTIWILELWTFCSYHYIHSAIIYNDLPPHYIITNLGIRIAIFHKYDISHNMFVFYGTCWLVTFIDSIILDHIPYPFQFFTEKPLPILPLWEIHLQVTLLVFQKIDKNLRKARMFWSDSFH